MSEENHYEVIQPEEVKTTESLTKEEFDKLYELIGEHLECFAKNTKKVGKTDWESFKIDLKDNIFWTIYHEEEGNELLEAGIITESNSEYSSPALLVKKPNSEHRLVIDYRHLKKKTKDRCPIPRIDDQCKT